MSRRVPIARGLTITRTFVERIAQQLIVADKTLGFKLAGAGFNRVGEQRRMCGGLAARSAVERLIGLRVVHSDRQRRFSRATARQGDPQCDHSARFAHQKTRRAINKAFRVRGINPARDQRGCSPPLETPISYARRSRRGIFRFNLPGKEHSDDNFISGSNHGSWPWFLALQGFALGN